MTISNKKLFQCEVFMLCKTIILSNSQNLNNNSPKGILTLSEDAGKTKGKIRLYNIITLPSQTKIGLYVNEKVHICPIVKKPNHYEFYLNYNIDISQSIYCALIDNSNNDKKVLLEGGSFNGFYFTDSPLDAVLEAKDEQLEQTIDTAIKQAETCEECNCNNCEYKKYFYQNYTASNSKPEAIASLDTKSDEATNIIDNNTNPSSIEACKMLEEDFVDNNQKSVIDKLQNEIYTDLNNIESKSLNTQSALNNNIDLKTENNNNNNNNNEQSQFLNDIIYQLDEMLNSNPEDDVLNSIIPNSRFVRIASDNPYVLGVIYENDLLRYIAYGVPAQYNTLPPAELSQHYQWLPLNPRDVMSDGYFMIYQDALSGNLVEINFE